MKPNYLFLLFILFLLPIGVLLIYGSKSFNKSTKDIEFDFSENQKEATKEIKKNIDNTIFQMQLILRNTINWQEEQQKNQEETFNNLQEINNPYIKKVFLTNQEGKLVYPIVSENKNQSETEFIEKTKMLWQNKNFAQHIGYACTISAEVSQSALNNDYSRMNKQSQNAPEDPDGLYPYYGALGLNLIYWKKLSNQEIIGADLNISYIKAKLISNAPLDKQSKAQYHLLDDNQKIIHQWGNLSAMPINAKTHQEYLSPPFQNWTIINTEPLPESLGALKNSFQTSLYTNLVIIALLFILCGAIAYFFMMKESKQLQKRMNFITEVSHELKTPLTNIRLYSELLERKIAPEDQKSKAYIQVLLQETQRLSRMIHNVLTFRKLNSKINDMVIQVIDINLIATQCLSNFEPLLVSKGFVIERKFELQQKAFADPDALEQILSNLISNVEKYALEGKYICLHTYVEKDFAVIECIDHGTPLNNSTAKLIFQPFYRAHKELSHGAGGTGIGLTISEELAVLNRGDLICIPSPNGNLFRLRIPLSKDQK